MNKQSFTEPRKLMGIQEAAEYLGIKVTTLYEWVSMKKIPFYKIGRLVKFNLEDLNRWVDRHKVEALEF